MGCHEHFCLLVPYLLPVFGSVVVDLVTPVTIRQATWGLKKNMKTLIHTCRQIDMHPIKELEIKSLCLKRDTGLSSWTFQAGYFGSKFQMRDLWISFSTREYLADYVIHCHFAKKMLKELIDFDWFYWFNLTWKWSKTPGSSLVLYKKHFFLAVCKIVITS